MFEINHAGDISINLSEIATGIQEIEEVEERIRTQETNEVELLKEILIEVKRTNLLLGLLSKSHKKG
jgi:hypothetical protein